MAKSDRDPDKWRLRRNTQVKHDILYEYLKGWLSVFSARQRDDIAILHYVDNCAGRGWYEEGSMGSPLLAMKVGQQLHDDRGGTVYLECYNVEEDEENFEDLENEIEAVRSRYHTVGVRNFQGRFQEHLKVILGLIPPDEPAFVFIDPFGYKGIELDTVLQFVARRWNEVFITFMTDYIGRYMTDRSWASAMDEVFGTTEWRRITASPTANQKIAAVELYCKQLQAKTRDDNKPTYVFPTNVAYEDRASAIYHLIHVSHLPKARVVMESAINRANHLSMEERLFIEPEVQEHVLSALQEAPAHRMTALNLAGAVWQRSLYPSWKGDVKGAIRGLEASGEVEVRTHNGRNRTKGGIEEKDVVSLKSGR